MRLKLVTRKSFIYSEATLYQEVIKETQGMKLGKDDVVAMISLAGDQIVFVHGFTDVIDQRMVTRRCLMSTRYRLDGGYWNPLMLQNYAEAAGIHLEGLKRFEQLYEEAVEERRAAARDRKKEAA